MELSTRRYQNQTNLLLRDVKVRKNMFYISPLDMAFDKLKSSL